MPIGVRLGLNLDEVATVTPEEWRAFCQALHGSSFGGRPHPLYRFWYELRPDRIKHQRLVLLTAGSLPGSILGNTVSLHNYLVQGFDYGVDYETTILAHRGMSKAQILDVYALAQTRAWGMGISMAEKNAELMALLKHTPDPVEPCEHPEGWEYDPEAFQSGMDFSELDITETESELLDNWCIRYLGEIPVWVTFMKDHSPHLLKQLRHRWETTFRALPKQYMPHIELNWALTVGDPDGVRESLLLCRGFGIEKQLVIDNILFAAAGAGGRECISLVGRVAGDILTEW